MQLIIRNALISDSQCINAVSNFLGYPELSSSNAHQKLTALINSPQDQVYVAEQNGQIIGWLHLFYARRLASESFYEIGGLVVSPAFRSKGVGNNLVQYALDKNKGNFRVRCNELRAESHQFYQVIGFVSSKVQRVFQRRSDQGV